MSMVDDGLRAPVVDTAGVDVVPPSTANSVPFDGIVANESGT